MVVWDVPEPGVVAAFNWVVGALQRPFSVRVGSRQMKRVPCVMSFESEGFVFPSLLWVNWRFSSVYEASSR